MTREEQLKFCKACKNQKFDVNQGIICGLTNERADFSGFCSSYVEDEVLKQNLISEEFEKENALVPASKDKRFANYLIDMICMVIFGFLLGAGLGIILALVSPSSLSMFDQDNKLLDYAFNFIIGMTYYTIMEASTGRSIGKYITKTKVVNEKGEKPSLGTAFVRSLCRFIPFEAFSFLGSDSYGWHDKFSDTRVVKA